VIGLPLIGMYIEREHLGGEWVELGAFYRLGDGSALAFFNFADPKKRAEWKAKQQSLFVHVSLLVERSTQNEILARLKENGLEPFSIDHGYCYSIYIRDPDGLLVEFTVDPPNIREITETLASSAHADMIRWTAGDRTSNNQWRASVETDAKTT